MERRGNYAANVGIGTVWLNDPFWMQNSRGNRPHVLAKRIKNYLGVLERPTLWKFGPFRINEGVKLRQITDGLSKTAGISELRKVPGDDTRGVLHYGAGVLYMHDDTPNPSVHDNTRFCNQNEAERLGVFCAQNIDTWRGAWKHHARSSHTGGVNSMFLDCSVRFMTDSIDKTAWQAMGSYAGREVVNSAP